MNYFSYFSEIEEAFVRHRGRNLLLSPLDWALIDAWKERGVPLPIVLRAIDSVFEKSAEPSKKRNIKSLMYCRDEVEVQYELWQKTQVGAGEKVEEPKNTENLPPEQQTILEHLARASEKLKNPGVNLNHNWQKITAEVLRQIQIARRNFSQTPDAEQLEIVLSELDRKIDDALFDSFPAENLDRLKRETAGQLRGYKNRMTPPAYEQTFRTLLVKSLRESADLPRLSLFYL